jgi:hypothetical protein
VLDNIRVVVKDAQRSTIELDLVILIRKTFGPVIRIAPHIADSPGKLRVGGQRARQQQTNTNTQNNV